MNCNIPRSSTTTPRLARATSSLIGRLRGLLVVLGLTALASTSAFGFQGMTLQTLHTEGRFLVDPNGKKVTLHGYMQPAASWFNGEGRNFVDPSDFSNPANVSGALTYLKNVASTMTHTESQFGKTHGWYSTFVRFIGDDGGVSNFAPGWDVSGALARPAQFNGWIENMLVPYINHCRSVGLYVVICGNPSVAYPGGDATKNMSQQYQQNLITFWTTLASHPSIKNADNVMFEICNEPIAIESTFGAKDWGFGRDIYWTALTRFMQPVVDAIRGAGAENVIWLPGLGWQGEYQGFPAHPLTGTNLGYAAHVYPAYGGAHDNATLVNNLWRSNYKPAADQLPMLITELMWTPNDGVGYQDLWNATTPGFGMAIKDNIDRQGNVSYLIGMTGDVLGNLTAGYSNITYPTEQGAQASFSWWTSYLDSLPTQPDPAPGSASTLINISTRSNVGSDAHTQIAGFAIKGTASKRVLIRASGPALTPLGVTETLADPILSVVDESHALVGSNDDWDASTVQTIAEGLGAFNWTSGSHDSALVLDLAPGLYTAQVTGKSGATGVGLVEIYDADPTAEDSKIINLSTRSDTLTGSKIQIAGFVIKGTAPKKVLIRASGPSLGALGVAGTLADPVLTLLDSMGVPLTANDDWDFDSTSATATASGAFAWTKGSKDAALIATLLPGAYTAQVTGKASSTGVTLIEVYEAP